MINEMNKYITDLSSEEPEVRRLAVERLGEIQNDQRIEYMLKALGDNDWRVRKTAVSVVLNCEFNVRILNGLIGCLKAGNNAGMRNAAVEALTKLGKIAVPYLKDAFQDDDSDVRKFVVDILGDINDKNAIKVLIDGLSDVDENVCLASVEALGKLKDEAAVEPLMYLLKESDDKLLSYTIIKAFEKIRDPRIVDVLISVVKRKGIEKAVIEALGTAGDIKSLDMLIDAFKDIRLRNSAIYSIVNLYEKNDKRDIIDKIISKTKEALDNDIILYLINALDEIDPRLMPSIIKFLGWSGDIRAAKPLLKLLDSDHKNEVIEAIINIGKDSEDTVIEEISKGNKVIREGAARILGEIGDKKAINALILLLGDESGHVRQTSAIALGNIGDAAASKPLIDLLNDQYENVQEAAVEALGRIKDKSLIPHFIKMLSNENVNIRQNAVKILGNLKAKEAIGNLLFMLKDESHNVRKSAVTAIDSINVPASEGGLMLALTDEDKDVRYAAVTALVGKKNKKFLYPLISLLKDNDIWIRAAVVKGIGEIAGRDTVSVISDMLADKVGVVRIAAIETLGRIGDKRIAGRILELLNDNDLDVKIAAIKAIGQLGAEGAKGALEGLIRTECDAMLKQYAREVLENI